MLQPEMYAAYNRYLFNIRKRKVKSSNRKKKLNHANTTKTNLT